MNVSVGQLRQDLLKLLEEGQAAQAVDLGLAALETFPDDAQIIMLYGLCLEQVGRVDEAITQLKKATELAPTDPETFHNLAVALYNQGDLEEAQLFAAEALKLDPAHEGALNTLKNCEAAKGSVPFEAMTESIPTSQQTIRQGSDDAPVHVLGLGPAWTLVGYGLVPYCVLSFAFLLFVPFISSSTGSSVVMKQGPLPMLSFFLYVTQALACFLWTLFDVIDRREKFVWLLPIFVCGFSALPLLPLCLYLAFRRKMIQLG